MKNGINALTVTYSVSGNVYKWKTFLQLLFLSSFATLISFISVNIKQEKMKFLKLMKFTSVEGRYLLLNLHNIN